MIRLAIPSDIDKILEITKQCALAMIKKDIYQWNDHYPSKEAFENDLARNELYVIVISAKIIGCITLSNIMDEEYKDIQWLTVSANNLYIHRLAIQPHHQGKGYAQQLMDFAEKYAKHHKYKSIRLDTFSKNKRNQLFYEQRNYTKLGNIYFPKQSEFPFHCYEKLV